MSQPSEKKVGHCYWGSSINYTHICPHTSKVNAFKRKCACVHVSVSVSVCEQVTVRVNGSSYTNVIVDLYKCVLSVLGSVLVGM